MSTSTTGSSVVRLAALRGDPLSVEEVLAAVSDHAAGGACLFIGTVRDLDGGRPVSGLTYEAHPSAETRLHEVAERVAAELPVTALAATHRYGDLALGDTAVVVAAAAPHRDAAFAACRLFIDTLKNEVPIWKHQRFADGGQEWVGAGAG